MKARKKMKAWNARKALKKMKACKASKTHKKARTLLYLVVEAVE